MSAPLVSNPGYSGLGRTEAALPAAWYYDPAQHERELRAIWYRSWVYLCRASALAEPLAFRLFRIGDQELILLRDEGGILRAFHNTCRHRGSRLCNEEAGQLASKRLVCPYHRWSYSLRGELQRAVSLSLPADFDPADWPLYAIALREWGGFVFINLAGDSGPVEESFDRESDRLDNWPLERLVSGHVFRKVLDCNWKIFWDNFNECLHCPGVHPELSRMVPIYGRAIMAERDDPHWAEQAASGEARFAGPAFKGGLREGAVTWSMDGQAHGAHFPNLSKAERKAGYAFVSSLPSMYVVAHVDYVRAVRLRPLGPERTELVAEWLFPAETLADPAFDLANVTDFATLVMEQDGAVCELNQAGLKALPHEAGVLLPEEYALKGFHDWVRAALADS